MTSLMSMLLSLLAMQNETTPTSEAAEALDVRINSMVDTQRYFAHSDRLTTTDDGHLRCPGSLRLVPVKLIEAVLTRSSPMSAWSVPGNVNQVCAMQCNRTKGSYETCDAGTSFPSCNSRWRAERSNDATKLSYVALTKCAQIRPGRFREENRGKPRTNPGNPAQASRHNVTLRH